MVDAEQLKVDKGGEGPEEGNAPRDSVGEGPTTDSTATPRQTLDEAHRCMALKQWEKAADQYAVALETLSEQHPEDAPLLAPILHRYGRCLLEHAIASSGALGGGGGGAGASEAPLPKRKADAAGASSSASKPADPRFSFGGDAEEDEEDEENEGDTQGQNADDTDDLSTAFSVLDLARVIYQRLLQGESKDGEEKVEDIGASLETLDGQKWEHIKIKTELAEVLNDLGDVGLESEDFSQAASDYESSLMIISPFVSPHSRRLADAYLRLGLALEFHPEPERQSSASTYVESAVNALKARLEALQSRQSLLLEGDENETRAQIAAAKVREEKALAESGEPVDELRVSSGKGKEKSKASLGVPTERDDVTAMDEVKVAKELKDVEEMLVELNAKLEEYSNPADALALSNGAEGSSSAGAGGMTIPESAKLALKQAINDAFLGASTNTTPHSNGSGSDKPVTDITNMVKRKKRPAEAESLEQHRVAAAVSAIDQTSSSAVEAAQTAAGTATCAEPQSKRTKVEDGEEE